MASNADKIFCKYGDGTAEDGRLTLRRSAWLECHYTKQAMSEFIGPDSRVLEIGCATGHYGLHWADTCNEYVGVDLCPPHIEIFTRRIAEHKLTNVSCHVGDAVTLDGIGDGCFDVVCCFGPMYHLPPAERELVFAECRRVCAPGGVAAFAYTNKIGVYVGACVDDRFRSIYPNPRATEYIFRHGTDDVKTGLFYFSMPEEMEQDAARHGFAKIRNRGMDFFITENIVNAMDDEKFELYKELADEMVKYESCTGMSNHALLICRKR